MQVLFNATTLHSGGGLQVGLSLACEALERPAGVRWRFAVSPAFEKEMRALGRPLPGGSLVIGSPSRDRESRRTLGRYAAQAGCDAVFTAFGPAYVRFPIPHVMGVADGWTTHSTLLAYRSLPSLWSAATTTARCVYKGLWYRQADRWIVEAPCARLGLSRRLGVPAEKVTVVPNTCTSAYRNAGRPHETPGESETLRVLTFAYPYPHKDLGLVPKVAAELKRLAPHRRFEFVTSVPTDHPEWKTLQRQARAFGVEELVTTVGRVPVAEGPGLYRSVHLCLMPTLLETFSAAYPEAMAVGLPVVTTDLDFARDVCGDAAMYFRPRDARDAARCLAELADSPRLWSDLVRRGRQRVENAPDAHDRYDRVVETLRRVAKPTTVSLHRQAA